MATTSDRDDVFRAFIKLCQSMRAPKTKNMPSPSSYVEKMQTFLSDDHSRQLVHRWRSWGYLLNSLLHVVKDEMGTYLNLGKTRKRKMGSKPKLPQLRYWHYLRTELQAAHVEADGPFLHLDPNGRDCISQLFSFCNVVIDRGSTEYDRDVEIRVDKEAWLTIEELAQYRVYCAILERTQWESALEAAMGSFTESSDLISDNATAPTRARVVRFLLKNSTFDVSELLPKLIQDVGGWFNKAKRTTIHERRDNPDSLLLVVASGLLEMLTDLTRTYFSSIGPYMLNSGIPVLKFIAQSNKGRKNGLRGAPAQFIVQFLKLYQYNADGVPYFKYLAPITLLRELVSLKHIVLSADEMNLMVGYARSARERRMGALGIDDQGIQQLACAADIVFHHDRLVSELAQGNLGRPGDDDLLTQAAVGDKRPRPIAEVLAWETVIEYFIESPHTETQFATAGSFSLASQRIVSTGRHASQTKTKVSYDPGLWLLLLLSILCRHGDYYVSNRIGDLMMVMKKLSKMLIAKEVGKPQSLALLILIQMANLSAKHRKDCSEYFDEHWATVWRSLLRPELPYARATEGIGLARGQVGNAVLTLLNCCIGFSLVSVDVIESSSDDLWNLPTFRQPTADSPAATMMRGDSLNPYARTSMASMCLLLSLLRRVQLPEEEDTSSRVANGRSPFEPDEEIFENEHAPTRSRLLQAVFGHLRTQMFRRNTIMPTGSTGCSFTKADCQTELSSLLYAAIIRSFCRQATPVLPDRESIFIPELICRLSARSAEDCTSWITGDEFNGFGVTFCMLESGLECLLSPFSPSPTIDPMAFSPIIQAFLSEEMSAHRPSWYDGVDTHAMMPDDQFEALAVPAYLMRNLIPVQEANRQFSHDNFLQHGHYSHAQSISKEREFVLETMIFKLLSDLLTEMSSKLQEIGSNPIKKMRVLASSFDVGLVLAVLYAEEEEACSQRDGTKNNRLIALLKQFFAVVADNFKPSEIVQAQQSHSVSESVVHTLRKFHSVILILQGRQALKNCIHPSADQINLRFPPEIRPSIRSFVNTLEESLASLSGSNDAAVGSAPQISTLSRSLSGSSSVRRSSWESASGRLSNSLHQSQQQLREEWDAMDDGEEDDISRDRPPSRAIQKNISLWCFRMVLLLKKDSGLSAVKKFADGIHFEPDFLLAVAVLLCGVAGADSLELFIKVIDSATEEGACERSRLLTKKGGSCRAPIFLSQVLSVLRLAGSIYEKRKYQQHEQVPEHLVQCARKYLKMFAEILPELQLGMAKTAQLQCFEVFFRLKIDEFEAFTEVCPARLADKDMNVRIAAARGLQSIHHMYWEGGPKVFLHCFELLQGLLEAPPREVAEASKCDATPKREHAKSSIIDPRLCMDTCLSVLLSLYVSACSSQLALPEVLGAFVDLASSTISLHAAGTPSLISCWMGAIAQYYGYANVSSLLDDHFCELWQRFILASTHSTQQLEEEKSSERTENDFKSLLPQGTFLLEKFPLSTLLGEDLDSHARRMHFVKKVDVIFPIGVFRNFISGRSTGVTGWEFGFVGELASYFSHRDQENEGQVEHAFSNLGEQVTTDLFALSFILMSYPDPDLKTSAHQMLGIAEERAKSSALTLSHLGHIASKMARFTVWNITQGDDEQVSQSELWKGALAEMKAKYSEFDWEPINLAELLSEFYVILLRGELYDPRALCAVECFKIFVDEIRDALTKNPVLQQLLLSICFQSIKHLAVGNRREIGSVLTLLVCETCKCFMNSADMFGQYIGTVVREIADILSKCGILTQQESRVPVHKSWSRRKLSLTADDQAKLEWVIFSICNELGSGLGKYTRDIDLVPNGIAASLDKLNALIIESRKITSSAASQGEDEYSTTGVPHSARKCNQAQQHIEMFIKRERSRESKFYKPVLFSGSPDANNVTISRPGEFIAAVCFNAMTKNIDTLRDTSCSTSKLFGKLAHTLLYLSSVGAFGNAKCSQSKDAVYLANALGELGALDASEYELSLADQEDELSRLYQRHFHRGALREIKTTFPLLMHERLLAYLSSLLFESKTSGGLDPSVLEETLRTLKRVLNLDEGVVALARCKDGELKAFISPFERSSPSNWSSASPRFEVLPVNSCSTQRKAPRTLAQMVELWTSASELGFTSWVCLLTSCLASESPDPVLKACSTLVAMRVDMAVFLFPYLLESILQMPEVVAEPSRILKATNQGIQFIVTGMTSDRRGEYGTTLVQESQAVEAMQSQPLEAVQLVIHSINFLREVEKARFVETNGNGEQKQKTKPQAAKKSRLQKLSYDCKIDVDLLAVARAAVRVKMPYSAMQYVEMWLEKQNGGKIPSLSTVDDDELGTQLRDILLGAYAFDSNDDGVYGVNDGRTLKSQLVKYHRESQYAKALPLYDVSLQIAQPRMQKIGGVVNSGPPQHVEGMLTSLQSLGYNHLLEGYLQSLQRSNLPRDSGSGSASIQALEHKYELAWKNMQWDAVLPGLSFSQETDSSLTSETNSPRTNSYSHQQLLFQALRAFSHDDFKYLLHVTNKAKAQILQSVQLGLHSFESVKDSYSALIHLQSIHEIEELADHISQAVEPKAVSGILSAAMLTGFTTHTTPEPPLRLTSMPLLDQWRRRYSQIKNDFDKIESLLSLEEILIQVSKPSDDTQVLAKLYLDLASFSRKAGRVAIAYRALLKLEQLEQRGCLEIQEMMQWKIQKAKLLWSQQEGRSAIWTAKKVCSEISTRLRDASLTSDQGTSLQLLQVTVLTITGKWIATQRSESSQVILEDYFQKATEVMSALNAEAVSERARDAAKAHFALAEYMASMYQQVSTRVTSREWLAGKKVTQARYEELQECQTMDEGAQMENRAHMHALNKEVGYDIKERAKVEASVDQFLIGALCSYGRGLSLSPRAELDMVFRVLSLWFNNQRKADINRIVAEEVIDVVPSYKFVPLSYQIISRVSSIIDGDTFQAALRKLVMKLSEQHPHHTLVQLIALKNSGAVEGKGALQFRTNVGDAKSEGAKVYLDELQRTEQRELLASLDIMADAYVQLALLDTRQYHTQKKKIPLSKVQIIAPNSTKTGTVAFDQCLRDRSRRANRVVMPAVLTSRIAPQPDMDYSNVARMLSFEPQFSITDSGIHRPKIIYCYGSDGHRYKQLVKGQDDTRQDLVIEQVFDTMNQFLMEERATRKRKLRLRTYRVVPLSPIAGVLEWVENTTPWGSYLVGRTSKKLSAHERYHPHELKHAECRQILKNATDKLAAFSEIQENFTPVFHHFFLEKFPDPVVWYHRRLAYTQSAAVTSIVGYILGIGDRHSQNILIHEDTGELVHIDFGVVFDQGMALFTPETVPFRLTRDMVDGMGVSGVDGVFTRSCEVTLQLLRKKSASVVTILEVFVHDPLYRWTLSPLKALRIQEGEQDVVRSATLSRTSSRSTNSSVVNDTGGSSNETQPAYGNKAGPSSNDAAARALIRVKQKLEGYEDPNGNALSIEGQVKHLMSVAQDPHNLCVLFPGWAPWL